MHASIQHISTLILIAGLSGAGRSTTIATLSDLGFYVIDNLPVPLLPSFFELSKAAPGKFARTALHLDIESNDTLSQLLGLVGELRKSAPNLQLLFLDCKTETVIKRYSETRRPHPGFNPSKDRSLEDTVQRERSRLAPFREISNLIVDSSELTIHDLRREIQKFIESIGSATSKTVRVNFVSFGFKYGLPIDCDLVVDVRFLPNPHFVDEFREKTGMDPAVSHYVLENSSSKEFVKRYVELLDFLLPRYVFEGKSYINIGVGCTGGKHRSVAIAAELERQITKGDFLSSVKHRDANRASHQRN